MKILDTTLRIEAGHDLILVPIALSFAEAPGAPPQLVDGELLIAGRRLPWTIKAGHLFDSRHRTSVANHPRVSIALCDKEWTLPARRHTRPDGMETILLGNLDLAETPLERLITEPMRQAAETHVEALGRTALKAF